jgi:hypothetical protein
VGGLEGAISAHERAIAAERLSGPPPYGPLGPAGCGHFPRSQSIFSNTFSVASGASMIVGGPCLTLGAGRRDDSDAVRTMCGLQLPRRQG